jgi:FkbM family methyltransferase
MWQRTCEFLARSGIAVREFGLVGAWEISVADRLWPSGGTGRLRLRAASRPLTFRKGTADRNAIVTHFCTPQLRLGGPSDAPIRTIVDAGAFIGLETVRMLEFYPHARILAVEAEASNYATLVANSTDDRVTHLHAAVWKDSEGVRFKSGGKAGHTSHVSDDGTLVPSVTIGDLLERCGGAIDFLKIDVEGAEHTIFGDPRMVEWLPHIRVIAMECPDNDACGATLVVADALRRTGCEWSCRISGELLVWRQADVPWTVDHVVGVH